MSTKKQMIITDSKNKYVKVGDIFSVELYNPAKITIGGPEGTVGNDVVDSKGGDGTDEPTAKPTIKPKPSKTPKSKQLSLRELIMQMQNNMNTMQNNISKIQDNMKEMEDKFDKRFNTLESRMGKMEEKIDDIVKLNDLKTK
ncbi:MAG: hypothetical protein LBH55_02695 [Mycoplasmataceae bacterium]|jgi:TolA-binding protein|nr:hypothetical protein [Mycoplasmataceae bacterium]